MPARGIASPRGIASARGVASARGWASARGFTGIRAVDPSVFDIFTDPDNTLLTDHAPDIDEEGGGWVLGQTAVWEIVGNQAIWESGNGAPGNVLIDSGLADCIITCDIETGTVVAVGLTVRASAGNDNIEIWLNRSSDTCTLHTNTNGSRSGILATNSITIDDDTEYALKVTLDGTSIKVEIDDVEQFTYTTSFNLTDTLHGLMQWNIGATSYWDDFRVDAL